MIVTLVVPDPPPIRAHPGRAADRHAPNAGPLVRAGEALIRAQPVELPMRFAGMIVRFGRTLPDVDPLGYQPEHPIIEVLADVGVVTEPEGWWTRSSRDDASAFYVVTFTDAEDP